MTFDLVVAYSVPYTGEARGHSENARGIGLKGTIPWKLRDDLEHFYQITKGGVVIMGRNTWESIPLSRRPLKERFNIVLTCHPELLSGKPDAVYSDLSEALYNHSDKPIFIIGGSRLYEESIQHPDCRRIYITEVYHDFEYDTFFPVIPERFQTVETSEIKQQNGLSYRFKTYC
jgi:dihydrofolate reductase